ncbi:molybdopterin cofactor-binding domain-containing protein [Novosphingobium sp.]|uniref:molybdopterin cofactor-binding domain-containing protein n=1 Tax=Novosphingobium sp. TaxID=1874826 RepID=UPI0034172105
MGAAGGLIAAWALTPRSFAPPLSPGEGEYAFDAWLKIGKDGVVSVAVPDLEMGQGVATLLAQVVAMELGADWRQVAIEPAPVSGAYANAVLAARWAPLWLPLGSGLADDPGSLLARRFAERDAFTATADGTALAAHEVAARAAAAGARAMLAQAAADKWGVSWEECEAQGGFILHDKNRASFAELVEAATDYSPPDPPVARAQPPQENPTEFPPGAPLRFPRLDLPSKVDGSHQFAADVRLPDMRFAAIRHAPVGQEARLGSFDAKRAPEVKLVTGPDWLAAVGETWWAAEQALSRIAPNFAAKAKAESGRIAARLDEGLRYGDANRFASQGDPDSWLRGKFEHTALYTVAPALHAGVETACATARFENGRLELWVASQAPQACRQAAARALDLSLDEVTLYPMPAGGSFDARLESEHAVEAALIAKAVGKPVQLTWSRWQEQLRARPRTPARAVMAARTAQDGSLTALKLRIAMPATVREFGGRLFNGRKAADALALQDQTDDLAMEGMVPPYAIEHLVVEHVPVEIGLPTGRLRGNSHGIGAFLIETFIDELAKRSGREALSYRMAMLASEPRLAACLQRAATLAEWGGGGGGSGQGLACWKMTLGPREGRIALVASARHDDRGIRVEKLTAVVDIGRIVNVDLARQQIEGGLLFGMGLANGCTTAYADGLPLTGRLGLMGLPLLSDSPEILVEFVESDADPFDPGELGAVIAPPAIANALYSAGSVRLHSLPLTLEQG